MRSILIQPQKFWPSSSSKILKGIRKYNPQDQKTSKFECEAEDPQISRSKLSTLFQGSCQEALMDAHAVSNANSFINTFWPSFLIWSPRWMCLINLFYSVLTVMTMAILINV